MSNSREASPDWLRSFQAPTHSMLTLSSDSNSASNGSPSTEDNDDHEQPFLHKSPQSPKRDNNHDKGHGQSGAESPSNKISKAKSLKNPLNIDHNHRPRKKKKIDNHNKLEGNGDHKQIADEVTSEKHIESHAVNHSVWTLSSDSEACPDNSPLREEKTPQFPECGKVEDAVLIGGGRESPSKKALNKRSPNKRVKVEGQTPKKEKNVNDNVKRKGNGGEVEVAEEELSEKHIEPHVSTSRLPLLLSEKVHRSKALVECEGESIDLSGDMGAVGRIVIPDTPSENHEMYLDLKGTIYKTTIVPSRTFCVVSFGQSEAKIEAIMNDFIQLKPQSNVYEAETMVEGTLDGFSFDSEDEAEKMPKAISHETDQNEGIEQQTKGKTKGKADKTSGVARKRGKTVGGKPQAPKKVKKKAQVPKKTKTKK